jgi:hypothetical protein
MVRLHLLLQPQAQRPRLLLLGQQVVRRMLLV